MKTPPHWRYAGAIAGLTTMGILLPPLALGTSLANGLDGYWRFDQTSGGIAYDSSGNGYNGTLVDYSNGQGTWTSGQTGGALQFGGPSTGQYVSVPNFAMPSTSMTLTAWVNATALPGWATIAANWNGGWGAFNYATFGNSGELSDYTADQLVPEGGINVDYGVSSSTLSLNQWHFVALVANSLSDTITFMQDGRVTGQFSYSGQLLASSSQLNIGDDPTDTTAGQGNWDGKIGDLAIWSRALSTQDLTSIYNAGRAGQPLANLVPEPPMIDLLAMGLTAALGFGYFRRSSADMDKPER